MFLSCGFLCFCQNIDPGGGGREETPTKVICVGWEVHYAVLHVLHVLHICHLNAFALFIRNTLPACSQPDKRTGPATEVGWALCEYDCRVVH